MGFFARNITSGPAVDVEIGDLGITVRVGEDYDLATIASSEVQTSIDLQDAITGGQVIILDPLDDTTPLSVDDSLVSVSSANVPPAVSLRWLNEWVPGTYAKNDMVLDAPWTMVANKTTTDRAAPQLEEIGFTLPDDIAWATNNQSTVVSGQEYTVDSDGLFEIIKYRVYLPTDSTLTTFVMGLDDVTSGRIEIDSFSIPEGVDPGWFDRQIQSRLVSAGDKIQVLLYATRFGTAEFNNVYQYFDDGLAPGTGEITSDLIAFSYVYASKTDKNSTPVNLSTLATGSDILIVESSASDRFQLWRSTGAVVDAGTYWNIPAEIIDTNKSVRNNRQVDTEINEPEGVNADYVVNAGYWTTNTLENLTATGFIGTDTNTIITNNNAYGADIFGGSYNASEDWDVVSLSSSGGSGATGIEEAPIDGTPYSRQDSDWLPSGTDFREPVQSGLATGGLVTLNTSTTIDIASGSGFIIDSYTDPLDATKSEVEWTAFTNVTVLQSASVGFTTIGIDNAGSIVQVNGPLTPSQERIVITLGRVYFEGGSIQSVFSIPKVVNQTSNNFYDYLKFLGGSSSKGLSVQKVSNQLSVFRGEGEIFLIGVEWDTDTTDPNSVDIPAVGDKSTPAPFSTVIQDGSIQGTGVTVIPKLYDDGTGTPKPVTGKNAVVHYLLENAGGARYLQFGQTLYADFKKAADALFSDATNHVFFPNAESAGFALLAQILVAGDAASFEDATKAGINNVLGEGGIANSAGSQSDELVKVNAADEIPDYLANKAVAGSGITSTILNPAGNEQLEFSFDDTAVNFREPTNTGLVSGGAVTFDTTTTVDVAAGTGFVMDSYTDPLNPAKTDVSWTASSALTVTQTNPVGFTSIVVDNTGTILQIDGPLTAAQLRTLVLLAFIYYDSGSIINVIDAPRAANQTATTFYDLVGFLGRGSTLANGLSVQKVDNPPALSIFRGEGEFFVPGFDWHGDKTSPNLANFSQDGDNATPAAFDVIFRDGTVNTAGATVIPKATDDGTLTPDSLGLGQATIHYMLENAGGVRYLQLGQVVYGSYAQAADRLFNDATNFIFFPNAASGGFRLLAQILVQGNANDFENTARAGINNILGEGGIANGAGSETDEKVKVTSTDTVPNYLNDKMTAGSGIQLNVTNPASNELLEVALGPPLQIAQLTGADSETSGPMLFLTDTTRGDRVLTVETTAWLYGNTDTIGGENIFPVHANHNAVGYVAPYDGTIIACTGYTDFNNSPTTDIGYQLNETSVVPGLLVFSGTDEQSASNTDVNADFSAGDRLRIKATSGSVDDVSLTVWVKWRKV